jgi:hypothetical protein
VQQAAITMPATIRTVKRICVDMTADPATYGPASAGESSPVAPRAGHATLHRISAAVAHHRRARCDARPGNKSPAIGGALCYVLVRCEPS